MRMNKFFMLGLAGLAFAACNNEEEVGNSNIEGTGMVEVTIQSPATRFVQTATTGTSVIVGGDITVEVYNAEGIKLGSAVINRNNPDEDATTTYTAQIFNVQNPTKVVAYCNDGKAVYDDEDIAITDTRLQNEPQSIPAYAEATLSAEDINGEMVNPDNGKGYKRYTKELALQIPVARLELKGVKHVDEDASCKFATLTINGVYLNNIYATKDAAAATDTYSWNEKSTEGGANFPILYDVVGEFGTGVDFKSGTAFPTEASKAFAYNFFAGTDKELPELKIYFNSATASSTDDPVTQPRYAIVKSYKTTDGEPITEFTPGTIYRITNVGLDDKYIGPNEGGETLYGVEVIVEEATWSVTEIEADWVEQ